MQLLNYRCLNADVLSLQIYSIGHHISLTVPTSNLILWNNKWIIYYNTETTDTTDNTDNTYNNDNTNNIDNTDNKTAQTTPTPTTSMKYYMNTHTQLHIKTACADNTNTNIFYPILYENIYTTTCIIKVCTVHTTPTPTTSMKK